MKNLRTKVLLNMLLNFTFLFFLFGLILGVLRIVTFLTNLDLLFFPIKVEVSVLNSLNNQSISEITVFLNGQKLNTNNAGVALFDNITNTELNIIVDSDKYEKVEKNITIQRSLNKSLYGVELFLRPNEIGFLNGRFVADENYTFQDDKLYVNDVEYKINPDGTFVVQDLVANSNADLVYESYNYLDVSKSIFINPGNNYIPPVKLEKSGDLVGVLKSYVREDIVNNVQFDVFGITDSQKLIFDQGKFLIKDLELGKEYSLRVFASGYLTQNYTQKINQGLNDLYGFKLVEVGKVIHWLKIDNVENFYSTNLDGSNLQKITNFNSTRRISLKDIYYDNSSDVLYFTASGLENVPRLRSSNIKLPYSIDLKDETYNLKRLIDDSKIPNLQNLRTFFRAGVSINLYEPKTSLSEKIVVLEVILLDESDKASIELRRGPNLKFGDFFVTKNKNYVIYTEFLSNSKSSTSNLIIQNINTKDVITIEESGIDINILDATYDGNLVIYTIKNKQTNLSELVAFNTKTLQKQVYSQNFTGFYASIWNQDEDVLTFIDRKDGRDGIFKFSLSQNTLRRVVTLAAKDKVIDFFHQSKYSFYRTNDSLYVVDLAKPVPYRKVNL